MNKCHYDLGNVDEPVNPFKIWIGKKLERHKKGSVVSLV